MSNPLEKIRKLKGRSWSEIRTRSKQTISAYSQQIGLSGKLPTDDEMRKLVFEGDFLNGIVTGEALSDKFFEMSRKSFFSSLLEPEKTIEAFRRIFGEQTVGYFVKRADRICEGRFDLLGYENLELGENVDWHYEPVSDLQAPMQHWKLFDELDSKETGDKKVIWELNRHQHFFVLGIAYLATNDEKYASAFVRHLDSWMDQNPPGMGINWFSSLEISFRAMSWLWAFHFFRGSQSFTSGIFLKALKYLFVKGLHIEEHLSTYYSPNTHLTGEALGLYYLGTQLPFIRRAEQWRAAGRRILMEELDKQILDDGVYFEQTTWYQRYTADFYLQFMILRRLNNDEGDEASGEKLSTRVQPLIDFLMFSTRPDGSTPIIGDDDGGRCLPITSDASDDFSGTLSTAAVVFSRGDYKYVSNGISQELLWLFGVQGTEVFDILEPKRPEQSSKAFPAGGYFVMRDGWSGTDNFLLFDAGDVGSHQGGHGHADTLSFELAVGGKTMLIDPGTFTYHKSKDLRDLFRSSSAHNTLTIDNKSSSECGGKFSWKSKAVPSVSEWLSHDRFDFVEASHNGYRRLENSPAEHSRSILFLRNEYWIMRDFVNTRGEHSYQQNFHFGSGTNPSIANSEDGSKFVREFPGGESGMGLFVFGDGLKWRRKEGWISKAYGNRQTAPFIQVSSKGKGPQEFFTFMLPRDRGDAEPTVFETDVAGGRAFVINYRTYQDLFVFADGDELIRTEIFDTDFRFLWARLSPGDEFPEEFVLIDGKHFSLGRRVVVEHPKNLRCAVARRFGDKLHVRTEKDVFSVSLPKNGSSTYILKTAADE